VIRIPHPGSRTDWGIPRASGGDPGNGFLYTIYF